MEDEIKFIKIGDVTVSMTHCSTDKFFGVCEHACSINGAKTRYVSSRFFVSY